MLLGMGLLSLILSLSSTTFFTDSCLKNRGIIRWIYGHKYNEGFWVF